MQISINPAGVSCVWPRSPLRCLSQRPWPPSPSCTSVTNPVSDGSVPAFTAAKGLTLYSANAGEDTTGRPGWPYA